MNRLGQALQSAASTFLIENGGADQRPEAQRFSAGRFPYTYGYDYIRTCLPGMLGRGEAGSKLNEWCQARAMTQEDREQMIVIFALRYLRLHDIEA